MLELKAVQNGLSPAEENTLAEFLFTHLEQYGDSKEAISSCLRYASGQNHAPGGLILQATENKQLVGVAVFNHTGMKGYIPEHILVYLAVHSNQRGKGLGKKLIEKGLSQLSGDVALHVEASNPAKRLYERMGFTNPYLEMRLKR